MPKDGGGVGKVTQMSRQKAARCRTGYRRLLGLADKRTLSLKKYFRWRFSGGGRFTVYISE